MTDARVRQLLIAFATEAGKCSLHGVRWPMFKALWGLAYIEGGKRGLWIHPKSVR